MEPLKENVIGSGFVISRIQRVVNQKRPAGILTPGKKCEKRDAKDVMIPVFSLRVYVLSLARI